MAVSNLIEKLGKAIFESPFGANRLSKDAPELAEIRLAVLDAVKAKSHRASGKNVFPYNVVNIHLLGVPTEQASVFTSEFLTEYFIEELKTGLSRSSYRFPSDLHVEIHTTPTLPLPGEPWLSVATELKPGKNTGAAVKGRRPAKLVVTHGKANKAEIPLDETRINIGRTVEVYRAGGPSRKNDLAFTQENEINQTVSREHAHILYSRKTAEYRLFNDRLYKGEANCGLWILRDGLSRPVHRNTRGTVLKSGDEIHLGSAVVRFQSR